MAAVGREALLDLFTEFEDCTRCPELSKSRNQVVLGSGSASASILVVGSAPDEEADYYGEPFLGASGQLLMSMIGNAMPKTEAIQEIEALTDEAEYFETLRDYLDRFVFWTTLVACRPPQRAPLTPEIKACVPRLVRTIYAVDPLVILALGKVPASRLLGKNVTIRNAQSELYDIRITSPSTGKPVRYPMVALPSPHQLMLNGRHDLVKHKKGDIYRSITQLMGVFELLESLRDHVGLPSVFPDTLSEEE